MQIEKRKCVQTCKWQCKMCQKFYEMETRHANEEGRTGVFSWYVISSFYFSWNVNLGNYSSWLVTWRFCLTLEESELLINIRDFTPQFYVILERKFSKLLE